MSRLPPRSVLHSRQHMGQTDLRRRNVGYRNTATRVFLMSRKDFVQGNRSFI